MDEVNPRKIDEIKETMLQTGSWTWNYQKQESISVSKGLCNILGRMYASAISIKEIKALITNQEFDEMQEKYNYHIGRHDIEADFYFHIKIYDGQSIFTHQRIHIIYDEQGRVTDLIGVVMNHTHQPNRDLDTRLQDEKFYRLFGDAPIGIALMRLDGTCILANKNLSESVQYKEYELKNLPFQMLVDDEDQHTFLKMYQSVIQQKIASFRKEYRLVAKDGTRTWTSITITSVEDSNHVLKYLIVMIQPSLRTEKTTVRTNLIRSIKEELSDLSLKDNTTGLYTRQYALRKIKEFILAFYERHMTFAVLMVDVDHIHKINRQYGHECGDYVIYTLSEVFKSLTREADVCSRWGGEEFILLFPEIEVNIAEKLAERLRNDVKDTIILWEGKEIQMTVSIFVTSYTEDDTLKIFVNKIDHVLYDAIKEERDTIKVI
jgi:diguanylate cyclase (GGDEF)-like protein/PAS domain S-box-containing protein